MSCQVPDSFLAISPTTKHEQKHDFLKGYAAQVQVNKAITPKSTSQGKRG